MSFLCVQSLSSGFHYPVEAETQSRRVAIRENEAVAPGHEGSDGNPIGRRRVRRGLDDVGGVHSWLNQMLEAEVFPTPRIPNRRKSTLGPEVFGIFGIFGIFGVFGAVSSVSLRLWSHLC